LIKEAARKEGQKVEDLKPAKKINFP